MAKVITWQTPGGGHELNICEACSEKLKSRGVWPREVEGSYCQVSYGLHNGTCHVCFGDNRARDRMLDRLCLEHA